MWKIPTLIVLTNPVIIFTPGFWAPWVFHNNFYFSLIFTFVKSVLEEPVLDFLKLSSLKRNQYPRHGQWDSGKTLFKQRIEFNIFYLSTKFIIFSLQLNNPSLQCGGEDQFVSTMQRWIADRKAGVEVRNIISKISTRKYNAGPTERFNSGEVEG